MPYVSLFDGLLQPNQNSASGQQQDHYCQQQQQQQHVVQRHAVNQQCKCRS
jgi:hypothetical protein